ncbi:hypothetical protein COU78_00700 [Candidatus Peregrinibacteria bacterium CG10_big_fil_rev_8_21_14_0_10_49_24]|nr:MAG: hypothetical protein COV83_00950 [Candidatus Peregrinibacteria bacterium CG11_big_fil_rev_8_21_14_0_20_49_14]PIR51472.1 MAG: hypothetical protein COU78_00700 [Candidatus Peregrinibacteria bacterium CG10_big_fil_rev_8_21_14_0_10_49_24]PJA67885.1 MAG: hypothetical protein CO157_02640 [Candidatus Peregrinibacteria bacterium CG_4_9_14_3_um_filter_49_12]
MKNTVIAFGYHNQEAPRHWSIKRKLEEKGGEMIECHTAKKGFLGKYADLTRKYFKHRKEAGTVLVTFPGHYIVPLAWLLTRFPRKRLVFDAFISLSDTLVDDRGKVSWFHPYAWFLYAVDFLTCHAADEVLIDTEAHRQFFLKRFSLKESKVRVVYLEARTDMFFPKETPKPENRFEVLFYGTYIPLQGIEHIIGAAAILEPIHPHIHFTLIGSGQTYKEIRALTDHKCVANVRFVDRVPFQDLPDRIRSAHLNLGIFGTSAKAGRVIPHKVYDAMACGMHVLTADTPAIHEKFDGHERMHLCKAGDPASLADAVATLSTKIS